jgi:hypothetical protein
MIVKVHRVYTTRLGVFSIAILVVPDVFGLVHTVCHAEVAAVRVLAFSEVTFKGALMTQICAQ